MYQKMEAIGYILEKPILNLDKKFLKFTLKTYKNYLKDGQKITQATFFSCIIFSGDLKRFSTFLNKGSLVFCEGEIQINKVTDDRGEVKYFTSFKVENFRLLKEGKDKDEREIESYHNNEEDERPLSPSNQKRVQEAFGPNDYISTDELPF